MGRVSKGDMRAKAFAGDSAPLEERIAWWFVVAVVFVVPVAVGKVPFLGVPSFSYGLVAYPKLFAFSALVGGALLAWSIGVMRGTIGLRSVPLWQWIATGVALGATSTVFAIDPTTAFFGGRYHAVGMFALTVAVAYMLLVLQLVKGPGRLSTLSWSVVAGGAVVGFVALLEANGFNPLGIENLPDWVLYRGGSLLGNPDFTGTYLVVPVVVSAAMAFAAGRKGLQATAWAAFAITASALLLTMTRGAWIGVVVGLALVGFVASRGAVSRRTIGAWVAAVAIGTAFVVITGRADSFLGRVMELFESGTGGGGRSVLWSDALAVIAQRPLTGVGPDSYRLGWYAARSLESVRLSGLVSVTEDPHSLPLLLAATVGVPAALAAVGLLVMVLVRSGRVALARNTDKGRLVYSGWWAALVGLSVSMLFATNTATVTVMFAVAMGALMAARSRGVEVALGIRTAIVVTSGVLAVGFFMVGALSLHADVLLRSAIVGSDVSAAERAVSRAPWHATARYEYTKAIVNDALAALQSGAVDAPQRAQRAESALSALIDSNPDEYANYSLAAFYLTNAGIVQGDDVLRRGLAMAERAQEIYPISAEAAYLKAVAQYQLGDLAGAATTLELAWDVDPQYADAGLLYAQVLRDSGERAEMNSVLAALESRFGETPEVMQQIQALRMSPPEQP